MSQTFQFDDYLHLMEVQGGSFVKALAHCYYMADASNKRRLLDAFPDYFNQYRERFEAIRASPDPAAQERQDHLGARRAVRNAPRLSA